MFTILRPSEAYMHQWTGSSVVQVMACCLFGIKPLPETVLIYCPVTIVVLATGHQVHCILWEQVLYSIKRLAFYVDWNHLHWIYFGKNTYNWVYVWCWKYHKKNSVKDMLMNNHELLNIQVCSFPVVWNKGCTQSLVVRCKYWVVSLVSTRISGHS